MQPIFHRNIYIVYTYIFVFLSLCSQRFWSYVGVSIVFAPYVLNFCQIFVDGLLCVFVAHIYVCTNSAFRVQSSSGMFFMKYATCKGLSESAADYSGLNYWTEETNEYMSVLAREKHTLDVSSSKTMSSG